MSIEMERCREQHHGLDILSGVWCRRSFSCILDTIKLPNCFRELPKATMKYQYSVMLFDFLIVYSKQSMQIHASTHLDISRCLSLS
jgi:hypothetical protein